MTIEIDGTTTRIGRADAFASVDVFHTSHAYREGLGALVDAMRRGAGGRPRGVAEGAPGVLSRDKRRIVNTPNPPDCNGAAWLGYGRMVAAGAGQETLSATQHYTCALTTAGGVKCWGLNDSGQLGDGTTTTRLTPVNVSGLISVVVAVSSGGRHTCALTSTGGFKCWGGNRQGLESEKDPRRPQESAIKAFGIGFRDREVVFTGRPASLCRRSPRGSARRR